MGDVGDDFRAIAMAMKKRKAELGVPCANCTMKLPKAFPKVLLPGQKCWCGHRDPRPNQSHEFWSKS
jgi:hypothetical protein